MIDAEIVKYSTEIDGDKEHGYAYCDCLSFNEILRVPRPENESSVMLRCPRCGRIILLTLEEENDETPRSY